MTDCDLYSILENNFHQGFRLWCDTMFRTSAHADSIEIFKNYFLINENSIEKNLNVLTQLATVFVTEESAANEYSRVCYMIKQLLG